MCERAIGRSTAKLSSEASTNTTQATSSPALAASAIAARPAPRANGARKKLVVSISPTPNTPAATDPQNPS